MEVLKHISPTVVPCAPKACPINLRPSSRAMRACFIRRRIWKRFAVLPSGNLVQRPNAGGKRLAPGLAPPSGVWTFVGPGMLRRSKIFIVTGLKHAISFVGAVSNRDPQVGKCIFGHAVRRNPILPSLNDESGMDDS